MKKIYLNIFLDAFYLTPKEVTPALAASTTLPVSANLPTTSVALHVKIYRTLIIGTFQINEDFQDLLTLLWQPQLLEQREDHQEDYIGIENKILIRKENLKEKRYFSCFICKHKHF